MSGWLWIALFVALLLGVGLWTDHKRRFSTGGVSRGDDPTQARRSAHGNEGRHLPNSGSSTPGGGDGFG